MTALEALPSRASHDARQAIRRLARHRGADIVLVGESGVGKSLFARAVHQCSSRSHRVFRECDLATVPRELAASVLFGHVRGAFTGAADRREGAFASAHTGTLFLDELGKASLELQGMMLTAVEKRIVTPVGSDRPLKVDVRCVFATNRPLAECIEKGEFHPDLAARVVDYAVEIAPLRERLADVPILVKLAVEKAASAIELPQVPIVSDELLEILLHYRWPNNVRQVFGVMGRIVVEADGASILRPSHIAKESALAPFRGKRKNVRLKRGDAQRLVEAADGNVSAAARAAGCDRSTLHRNLRRDGAALRSPVAIDMQLHAVAIATGTRAQGHP